MQQGSISSGRVVIMANRANLRFALAANALARHGRVGMLAAKLLKQLSRVLFSCDIGIGARIDPSVEFVHLGLGCVIHANTTVGKGSRIFHHVTIGSAWRGGGSR